MAPVSVALNGCRPFQVQSAEHLCSILPDSTDRVLARSLSDSWASCWQFEPCAYISNVVVKRKFEQLYSGTFLWDRCPKCWAYLATAKSIVYALSIQTTTGSFI